MTEPATILSRGEKLFPFAALAEPLGMHATTIWRAATKGTPTPGGQVVRLEYVQIGSRMRSSREAVERYSQALAEARNGKPANQPTPARSPAQRRAASEAAARQLELAGVA